MITTVTREIRGRKSPYTGQVPVRTVEYTQIEGVVTAVQEPTHSNVIVGGGIDGSTPSPTTARASRSSTARTAGPRHRRDHV